MQNLIVRITQENLNLIKEDKIGCFILAESLSEDFARGFTAKARQQGKLVLTFGEQALEKYMDYKADGLVVDTIKESMPQKIIRQIKEKAPKAILGVVTRNRRHEAMLVSECEPDFIIFKFWRDGFEANAELLKWYGELFLIQNAVWPQEGVDCTALPADFLIAEDAGLS